ncbi:MAG: bis-aminopropyl spermidine synthase family protein [Candidatus Bipolaricaulaceae bacterium]
MNLRRVVERVREASSFSLTERDVERILAAVLASGDIWEIIDLADVPILTICAGLETMRGLGWVNWDGHQIRLTAAGRRLCDRLGLVPASELRCPQCGGRGLELGPAADIAADFRRIAAARPEARQEFDQGYVTEDSTLYRVAFMWAKGDLAGKELITLGDDDLVSIAMALTELPRRVVMLDLDPRLVDFVDRVGHQEGLRVEAHRRDLRQPLPPDLRGAFDTFFCDPTESLRGFLAFAGRGLSALRGPGSAGYMGLTRREASLDKWRAIQQELLQAGVAITDLRDDFHVYVNWPYIQEMRAWDYLPIRRVPGPQERWYRSALVRVELTRPAQVEDRPLSGDIFNDAEAATT